MTIIDVAVTASELKKIYGNKKWIEGFSDRFPPEHQTRALLLVKELVGN